MTTTASTQTATAKQLAFLTKLVAERPLWAEAFGLNDVPGWIDSLSKQDASHWIGEALKVRPARANRPIEQLPEIPQGHYALPSQYGTNDLDFYRVDRPTEGRWAGRTFVKTVVGGHPDAKVERDAVPVVLFRIQEYGIEESATRYGQEIGRCNKCNRHLTDETSRSLGIGPECGGRR